MLKLGILKRLLLLLTQALKWQQDSRAEMTVLAS